MEQANNNTQYSLFDCGEAHLKQLYDWYINEVNLELYTCRPIDIKESYDIWHAKMIKLLTNSQKLIMIMSQNIDDTQPLGRFSAFDYNPRNRSIEIGFYFPPKYRGKGYGTIGLKMFIKTLFNNNQLGLNKIYATTAQNNVSSVKLLMKGGFHKDGENREHYWIGNNRYSQLVFSILRAEW